MTVSDMTRICVSLGELSFGEMNGKSRKKENEGSLKNIALIAGYWYYTVQTEMCCFSFVDMFTVCGSLFFKSLSLNIFSNYS